ncbi:hypothetical protein DZA65_00263 [Dickeya dianthicola]|nr:hypothetical protein [Dickeya dianthicola]ATO31176.1 Putative cytoplasmic protein [Dickeya dianthicola RNS04.9]AYC17178.1 hypothetical protein DZA65_00263 [Dickeya dianthicola]
MSHRQGLENYPDALRWSFGDSPELADELLVFEEFELVECLKA